MSSAPAPPRRNSVSGTACFGERRVGVAVRTSGLGPPHQLAQLPPVRSDLHATQEQGSVGSDLSAQRRSPIRGDVAGGADLQVVVEQAHDEGQGEGGHEERAVAVLNGQFQIISKRPQRDVIVLLQELLLHLSTPQAHRQAPKSLTVPRCPRLAGGAQLRTYRRELLLPLLPDLPLGHGHLQVRHQHRRHVRRHNPDTTRKGQAPGR